jgi:sec-independent protein translocase protein TatB
MFDIAFSELVVIALVALVVIGPERLPRVARTAGHLLGRLQRYVSDVKADINREIQLEELKKMQQQVEASARSLESSLSQELSSMENALNRAVAQSDTTALTDETVQAATPFEPPAPRTETGRQVSETAAPDKTA